MLKHSNIHCNGCDAFDFANARYECQICPNYNLCLMCYNDKKQTLNHLPSHRMLQIESSSTVNPNVLAKQHTDQMEDLQATYLSKMLSNLPVDDVRTKMASSSIKTLDKLSIDELYEYLLRIDPNLILLAEKLKNERVSGVDLVNFGEDDYKNCSITYGEKKKLQLLIERKQSKSDTHPVVSASSAPDSAQMQSEIGHLNEIIQKQTQEIQEKNSSIEQLEDIVEKQDQQTQLQDAIIKQLQETIEKQSEEMRLLIELAQQHSSLVLSSHNFSAK